MTQRLTFTVPGKPRPKARPRLGKNGNTYTPRATKDYENTVRWWALKAMREQGWSTTSAPCAMWVVCHWPDGRRRDLDNAGKSAQDALNGLVFADDSQIHELHLYGKIDAAHPRLEVEVERISEPCRRAEIDGNST